MDRNQLWIEWINVLAGQNNKKAVPSDNVELREARQTAVAFLTEQVAFEAEILSIEGLMMDIMRLDPSRDVNRLRNITDHAALGRELVALARTRFAALPKRQVMRLLQQIEEQNEGEPAATAARANLNVLRRLPTWS